MQEHNEDTAGPGRKTVVNPGKESDFGGCALLDTHPLCKFPEQDPQLIQSDCSLVNGNETERTGCNMKNSYLNELCDEFYWNCECR